jgi:hypothetical protein
MKYQEFKSDKMVKIFNKGLIIATGESNGNI